MAQVSVMAWKCERCEHVWLPRLDRPPKVCPKCKSPYWDRPRKNAKPPTKAAAAQKRPAQ